MKTLPRQVARRVRPITEHDKLPDILLYQPEKNWLFLIEADFRKYAADIAWETKM